MVGGGGTGFIWYEMVNFGSKNVDSVNNLVMSLYNSFQVKSLV